MSFSTTIYEKNAFRFLYLESIMLFLCFFSFSSFGQWNQIGSDVESGVGTSVCLSEDGSIMVSGSGVNGTAKVYKLTSGDWQQLGGDLVGEQSGDFFGEAVSISADGMTVVVGSKFSDNNGVDAGQASVYEFISGDWVQKGSYINGTSAGDNFGVSVSVSADGRIIAVGSHRNDQNGNSSGQVIVYEYVSNDWVLKGTYINGTAGDALGFSIDMNSDGSIIAISADSNDGNGVGSGCVRVYGFNLGVWDQIGGDIYGDGPGDRFGHSVSLNSDGSIVAASAVGGINVKYVKIYELNSGSWIQKGGNIESDSLENAFGISISLNRDGSMLAIGSHIGEVGGPQIVGYAQVYGFKSGNWFQKGLNVSGDSYSQLFGHSVSLNADGNILAVGASFFIYSGPEKFVRVYSYTDEPQLNLEENELSSSFLIYPNPTRSDVFINITSNEVDDIIVTDLFGKDIRPNVVELQHNVLKLSIDDFKPGLYFIKIVQNTEEHQFKIIKI